jgi:asparagine synthase (glutamine-hydrolysing)
MTAGLLTKDAQAGLQGGSPYQQAYAHLLQCPSDNELERIIYLDFKLYLENDILPKVDRASMACSLEVRVPLLNQIVLDAVGPLPVDLKIRGMTTKFIMKEAVKDLLPADIIHRKKKGFNMPVARWFAKELLPLLGQVLDSDKLRSDGIFDADAVQTMLAEHANRRRDNRKQLWALLVFQQWYDRYLRSESPMSGLTRAA